MASSKVWRKGRWFWYCSVNNNASNWKDSWACGATSRLTFSTQKEAKDAGRNHQHNIQTQQIRGKN